MGHIPNHFPLRLPLLCFLTVCSAVTATNNITTDQSALLALKAHLTEKPSRQILAKNWTAGSSVCEWIGVTCGSRHHRVTALNISNMNLTGTIPPQLGNLSFLVSLDMSANNFTGQLPNELGQFGRLRVLNLGFNNLTGLFPPWIGSFRELEYLSLRNNNFTGFVPPSISNMSKLTTLILSYNSLYGNLPAEVFNISSLEILSLSENSFSPGSLPDYICQHLQRLRWLGLQRTGLIGQIPSSIGQCLQLQRLYFPFNKLTGEIPKEIGNLQAIEILALGMNSLEGTIPKTIGNLTMLEIVDFNSNNLTGVIPEEIGKLYNIQQINFGWNKLSGSIPVNIFNISTLTMIGFGGNNLSGNLPSTIDYSLPNLEALYLNKNSIGGAIPDSISNSSNLQFLELSENNFTGPIPNSLGDLSLLQGLHLHQNDLISDPSSPLLNFITSLANCKYLMEITLSDNQLDGILPDSFGNLSSTLERVYSDNCKIKGAIPSGIGNLSSLNTLGLSDNQLTGSLPNSIKDLQNLQRIDLSGSKISTSIQLFCACQNLGYLGLEENLVGGSIPECLGNITSMRYLYLSSNGLNSSLPISFWDLKDLLELNISSNSLSGSLPPEINNLKMATWMDLSSNYFSGDIPSTIGDLSDLHALSLAHNKLQGPIPETIGKMLSLVELDLSYNFLSGSLPMSLETLQYLTFFNVSFNNLSGEIPSGGPFTNLTAESFISNGALCGAQRFHVPPCPSPSTHRMSSQKKRQIVIILVGVLITVVGAMCFGLVCLRYRRKDKASNDHESLWLTTQERISYYELLQATEGYNESNLLGTGSFGSVYKGTLEDGRIVAVKVFKLEEGSFKSFDTECDILRNLRHRNLTKVISSCSSLEFRALVLEYMPNGSLEKWLYSHNGCLNIMQRLNVVIDVACALQYLHYGNLTSVVHCDLKPSNVLLDHELVAHVSDFGVAKLLGQEDSITYTKTLATLCYLAPEYGLEGLVSTKCDVYSFGIMMIEVFTRKSPSNEMFGEKLNLKSWVKDSIPNGLANVIDANLLRASDKHYPDILACISSIMEVALSCTKESPRERSNIEDVLSVLNKIKLQLLPFTDGV